MPDSTAMKIKLGLLKGAEKYQKGVMKVGKAADSASRAVVQTMTGINMMKPNELNAMRKVGDKVIKKIKK